MTNIDAPDNSPEISAAEVTQTSSLLEHIIELAQRLQRFEDKFDERSAYDTLREKQITQLSDLVDTYKTGLAFPFLRSFALEIHRIREALGRFAASTTLDSAVAVAKEVDLFVLELDEALINQGFARLSSDIGSSFDAARHRASKAVPTADLTLDGVIADSQKAGLLFQKPDGSWMTVIPETVEVYKYTTTLDGESV